MILGHPWFIHVPLEFILIRYPQIGRREMGFSVCSLWVSYRGICVAARASLILGLNLLKSRAFTVLLPC